MNWLMYVPMLAQGTLMTLVAWLVASSMSLLIGTFLGIMSCHQLVTLRRQRLVRGYTFIAKGIPAYVQILLAYFVIPALFKINVSGFAAAVGALAFCSSGYVTEIVRSGINGVSRGQWDAAFVLGYSTAATLMRIILPQVFTHIFATLCGELEQLLKSTSLLATIGIVELTRTGMNIFSRELQPIPIYLVIAGIYLLFSAVLQMIMMRVEGRMRYGSR